MSVLKCLRLILLLALPFSLQAQFSYATNNGTIVITDYACSGGPVVVPETINGLPVTGIGEQAFFKCSSMTSIHFPRSVTYISSDALDGCTSLAVITVDSANACYSSFDGVLFDRTQTGLIRYPCGRLGPYAVPSGVTNIGIGAFVDCINLTGVAIPGSVSGIQKWAFLGCTSLATVANASSITSLGEYTFAFCSSLAEVNIPATVTNIGTFAFFGCSSLARITIPVSVVRIEAQAFAGCGNLRDFVCQGNAPSPAADVFRYVNDAIVYYLPGTTGWGLTFAGRPTMFWNNQIPCGYTVNSGRATFARYLGSAAEVIIPAAIDGRPVTNIGSNAFYQCHGLANVVVPNGVTNFDDASFESCVDLVRVTVPTSLIRIGSFAFCSCSNLVDVTIPGGLASIGDYAFACCASLGHIAVPGNVAGIGDYAFCWCSGLASVTIASGVTSIGEYAFACCSSLPGLIIPDRVVRIGQYAFAFCDRLGSISVPASVTSIEAYAFGSCPRLLAITVDPANRWYSSLDGILFNRNRTMLIECPGGRAGSYRIPDTVATLDWAAFAFCPGLSDITVPPSVTWIGDWAFNGCTHLASLHFEGNAPGFSWHLFDGQNIPTVYRLPDTSGWSESFDSASTGLWRPAILKAGLGFGVRSNQFGFNIAWASKRSVVVEACTNLARPIWVPLSTNLLNGGLSAFADPQWADFPSRSYRLRSP